ncbi:Sugar transporter STL1 [Pseudocercospora fuligena]|uniref:Sugar transporter STL1 n=1 Tax=Pseudocercospora fuligena TaxID=685502 RepID=A0A8H6RL00_9PEZI|nr:Sugar transporter STL1 [Pseudocercospora fuligena]
MLAAKISLRGRRLYLLMKIVCGTSFMMYGYDAGVLGGIILHKPFLDAIGNPSNDTVIPMIVASYDLAACVTALVVAFFAFRMGRRGTVILGNVAAIIGSVIQASSYSVAQLIVGRLVQGVSIGAISSAVPTYLSETGVEIGDRGPANALNAILLISGVPLAYWVDYGFTKMQTQASWRVPIIFQCIFAIISGGLMLFLPDTPRWYYARNRWEEGDTALAQLHDTDINDPRVQRTRSEILAAIEAELEANASLDWKQFLTMGIVDKTRMKIIRRLCMCFWLPMIREWMGSSLIAYYSSVILSTVAKPSLVSLLSGVLNIFFALGCVPLYFTVEKVGRRSILLYGAMTMTVLITIFTALVATGTGTESIEWTAVAFIFLFLFVFGWSWQGCVWLYCAEIAPLEYRHIGAAATAFGEWLMTFITVFAGPIGFDHIGWYFWLWVISGNVVAIIFVFLLCPETGGKTLEQVDYLFVRSGFAGLRKDFNVTADDMESPATMKEHIGVEKHEKV